MQAKADKHRNVNYRPWILGVFWSMKAMHLI